MFESITAALPEDRMLERSYLIDFSHWLFSRNDIRSVIVDSIEFFLAVVNRGSIGEQMDYFRGHWHWIGDIPELLLALFLVAMSLSGLLAENFLTFAVRFHISRHITRIFVVPLSLLTWLLLSLDEYRGFFDIFFNLFLQTFNLSWFDGLRLLLFEVVLHFNLIFVCCQFFGAVLIIFHLTDAFSIFEVRIELSTVVMFALLFSCLRFGLNLLLLSRTGEEFLKIHWFSFFVLCFVGRDVAGEDPLMAQVLEGFDYNYLAVGRECFWCWFLVGFGRSEYLSC